VAQKHLFAFYYPFPTNNKEDTLIIFDEPIIHRIGTVLRMSVGDHFILFNAEHTLRVELKTVDRKSIIVTVLSRTTNTKPSISLVLVLPLLKREALQKAIYGVTEMGVSAIQLVTTTKSRKSLLKHEFNKLQTTIIAASEQSKHFTMVTLQPPTAFKDYLEANSHTVSLVADPSGKPIFQNLSYSYGHTISLYVGPEGDFTLEEKAMLHDHGVHSTKLTSTVLQSYQAATLLVGICTSYFD
jgi:16S rRNA (uracil1498-N3)-methyltransferase